MSNTPKNASERTFQDNFVKRLQKYRWSAPDNLDGNRHKVTVQTLIDNWRIELDRMNADQLEGVSLTDGEFRQVLNKVNSIANSYEAAKILAMENSTGKIDGIFRDPNPNVTRKQVTLTIFRKADVGGGESTYQIAREVSTDKGNRFDIVLLINGLPLINIEQKRADISLDEAFNQFKRYYADGEYIRNFMVFSQMMIAISPVEMRYFATPKSSKHFNPTFCFHWADENNKPVNKWETVVDRFLMVPMAHQMVGDYLVINEAEEKENQCHMLMRPYQVYALQSVELAAFGRDNKDGLSHGGYIWHTTGSGKTITSFKTALFLSTRAGFDKIIFMVDRKELDSGTSKNFKAYASYEPVTVDDSPYTAALQRSLEGGPGIVVTTTFKVNNLIKSLIENDDYRLQNKKIVFIIDEAHRTTMGQMLRNIKKFFHQKGLFFGFTGTPLFDANHVKGSINEYSEAIKTTEALFGPKLHQYTIDEAIGDKNVLGFHIKYINTGEFIGYDDLRDKLIEALINEDKGKHKPQDIEEKVMGWDELKVENEAYKRNLFLYQDETHIPRVVERILKEWESQSQNRTFNAILTVAFKNRVVDYYKEFKKQLADSENPINIAMTVSFGNPNEDSRLPLDFEQEIFNDYESFTGVAFTPGDARNGEDAYYEDLTERGKRGGSGRNPKNIDLIIVADQMLTGYDDKYLNTLYVDRSLELQGLVQAYSRTNRVLGSNKEFGTIINFMRPKDTERAVKDALKLYGSGGETGKVIVDTYDAAVIELRKRMEDMKACLPDPTEWMMLESDEEARQLFLETFRKASAQLHKVEQYYEYKWNDERFGITYEEWLMYIGAYKNLRDKTGVEEPPEIIPLPGKLRVVGVQTVDSAYIIALVGTKVKNKNGVRTIDDESLRIILEKIQELRNLGEKEQADILHNFLDDISAGEVSAEGNADEAFNLWRQNKCREKVEAFAVDWGVYADLLQKSLEDYDESNPDRIPMLDEIRRTLDYDNAAAQQGKNRLQHMKSLTQDVLPMWLKETRKNYML